jgi:thioredoxin reductase
VLHEYGSERDVDAGDVLFAVPGRPVLRNPRSRAVLDALGYLGFPAGLSGEELATRGALQAQKFGVRMKLAAKAASLSLHNGVHTVTFDDGEAIQARSVIIATGAQYNRLPLDRLAEFEGVGVSTPRHRRRPRPAGAGRLP